MHFCRVLFLFSLVIFSPSATAQQNIFNVPSSDITAQTRLFFQEQLNFIQDGSLLLNTTFCYGLGREWEIGLNVLGIYIEPGPRLLTNSDASKPPLYPFYTINAQKAWKLSKVFKMAVGTQTGLSNGGHFGTYNYLNVVTALPQYQLKLITGFNVGTESFLGYGDLNPLLPTIYDPVGYQVGIEKELIHEKLLLQAEHISGEHSLGLTAVGLGYHITSHWVLSLGYQFSNNNNPTPNSVVFEFTFVPSSIISHKLYHEGHPGDTD